MQNHVLAFAGLLTITVIFASPTMTVLARSETNLPCESEFSKDKNEVSVSTHCISNRELVKQLKDVCKESGEEKCSSSQTGQGAFSNNPNKPDEGGGIIELFTH
jgi:hypothetical protein